MKFNIMFGRFGIGSPRQSVFVEANCSPTIHDTEELLTALKKSITEWHYTSEGEASWKYAGSDFNIGDLCSYLGDQKLVEILQENGISYLAITEHDIWDYDTSLTNRVE